MPTEFLVVTYKRDSPVKHATVSGPMPDESTATAKAREVFSNINASVFSTGDDCVMVVQVIERMERDYDPR